MCGIAGFWSPSKYYGGKERLNKMTSVLGHRGPDAEGLWCDSDELFLGHRRLSIVDLDVRSNQPFEWLDRFVLTFNGEIYNFLELKELLLSKGYVFRTNSDTEVICASYNEWGTDCLQRFDGMFAFALFDKRTQTLFCARDRFGEKPFYYSHYDGHFSFASEMKALWAIDIPRTIRPEMVHLFLHDGIIEDVVEPHKTFYYDIEQLKPSHYFVVEKDFKVNQVRYYSPSIATTFKGSFDDACLVFKALFDKSVERRMRADVSLGSSLSGGLDSSSIVTTMSARIDKVSTFSARFFDFKRDEGSFIEKVSNSCNTNHHDVFIEGDDLISKIDKLLYYHEEPFQSASINAQFEVYKEAKKEKTVVLLDGQGADEYLAGYFKFLLPYYYSLPFYRRASFREEMKRNQGVEIPLHAQTYLQFKTPIMYKSLLGVKYKLKSKQDVGIGDALKGNRMLNNPFTVFPSLKETLVYNLTVQGLPKLLKFADRNSMANSIEVRLPFLSHELVDFVLSLPEEFFFKAGWTKSILRHSINNSLPSDIVWRKDKVGFEAPHDVWLKRCEYQEEIFIARLFLIDRKIITASYSNIWNILILYRLLITNEKESFNFSL